ncbi:MAG: hypothetical protein JXB49_03350 [Bacteroidales bacterium]|nr:hypothetical protein [Bacteroidales bacterium]
MKKIAISVAVLTVLLTVSCKTKGALENTVPADSLKQVEDVINEEIIVDTGIVPVDTMADLSE